MVDVEALRDRHTGIVEYASVLEHRAVLPGERVVGSVALIRLESDSDFHVALTAGRDEMISESPAPSCDSRAFPSGVAR